MSAAQDEKLEAAILIYLLANPGLARTMPEMIRETEARRDDVNRALFALAEYGLLDFEGGKTETLRPTLAARSCRRLLGLEVA